MPQMPAQGKKRARGGGERVSKAPKMRRSCDACACAKRKCDGETRCSLCTKKGIPCVYSERQKSGPKGNHAIPEPAKQHAAAAATAADGCPTAKTGKTTQKRSSASAPVTGAGGSKPKKKVFSAGAAAAPAAATPAAPGDAGAKTMIEWRKKHQSPPSPLTPKAKTPRPTPTVSPIAAVSAKSSTSFSSTGPSRNDKPTTSPASASTQPLQQEQQQRKAVAKKEPRSRSRLDRKNHDGGKGKDPAAAPAVVSPVERPRPAVNRDGGARMPVVPTLPPRLSLSASKAAAVPPSLDSREKFATPPLSSILLLDEVRPSASAVSASGSASSIDGASSSLSWDDVPDVFVSSLEDDILWSCDDFSDDGTGGVGGGGGVGVSVGAEGDGDDKLFPSGGLLPRALPRGGKTVERTVSPTVEMMLLDDQPAPTTSHFGGGFGNHPGLHGPPSSPILQKRTSSPSIVSPRTQAGVLEDSSRHHQAIESDDPIVMGVLPSVSRRSSASTDIGRRQNPFRNIPSPISSWTQDAVEAGASTLLAVLADTDFCGTAVGRGGDGVTDDGGRHGGQQKQQHLHHNQYRQNHHHRPPADKRSRSTTTTIGNHNARLSLRWPPHNTSVSHGRLGQFGVGSRSSPPVSTPATTAAFAEVGSRPWHLQATTPTPATTRQQHSSQPQCRPVSLDGRNLSEGMCSAKGSWVIRRERTGSKPYQTASL